MARLIEGAPARKVMAGKRRKVSGEAALAVLTHGFAQSTESRNGLRERHGRRRVGGVDRLVKSIYTETPVVEDVSRSLANDVAAVWPYRIAPLLGRATITASGLSARHGFWRLI